MAELAHQEPKKSEAASLQRHDEIISQLRTAYAAFNRGDFEAAVVAVLVPKIEWTPLISAFQSAILPRGEVSRDNRERAENKYDRKSRPTGPGFSFACVMCAAQKQSALFDRRQSEA